MPQPLYVFMEVGLNGISVNTTTGLPEYNELFVNMNAGVEKMYQPKQASPGYANTLQEMNFLIDLLYVTPCTFTRNMLLNQLRYKVSDLARMAGNSEQSQSPGSIQQAPPVLQANGNFTLAELAKYTGKNGNPAYVAVNGIVYDVTNNAAWAAATHFGLTAGKDLTEQFNSCHRGQQILNRLKAVGRLV